MRRGQLVRILMSKPRKGQRPLAQSYIGSVRTVVAVERINGIETGEVTVLDDEGNKIALNKGEWTLSGE